MTSKESIYKELKILSNAMRLQFRAMMDKNGINSKTGDNTLIDSNLYKSIDTKSDFDTAQILINSYYVYVESGRRAGGKMPPYQAIAEWADRKLHTSDNKVIWAVMKAIQRDGIRPRPFTDEAMEAMDAFWNEWADRLFESIITDLNNYFND